MTSIIEKRLCLHRELENQQKQNKILRSSVSRLQGLSSLGTATCMIAHEINNLLTPLASYANLALQNPDDKKLTEKALQKTLLNCERARKVTDSILKTVNGRSEVRKEVGLFALVEEIFECLCRDFAKDRIAVDIRIDRDLRLTVVPVQIQQVLMNLIINARSAMLPGGGTLVIEAGENGQGIEIQVRDSGCGIETAELETIVEAIYTTRSVGTATPQAGGSGLGLAFCKEVIDAHKGRIWAESRPLEGSTFTITLPNDLK